MNIKYHSAVIFVKNINTAKSFYTDLLGQVIELDFGKDIILKGGITLWEIQPDHIIPNLLGVNTVSDERFNRFELCFETDDIDTIHDRLKKNGVTFLHQLHEEPWGQKTIRFFDPDKHLIEIGETLETFVKRLHRQNMTEEQISQKTSIPLSNVKEMLKSIK